MSQPSQDRPRQARETSLETESWDAFISYRRRDARPIAVWLRDRLKRFRLADEVLQQLTPDSKAVHARRARVFLDIAYEKSSPDFLEKKIYPALDQSDRLIVISSPAAFEPARDADGEERDNWLWLEIERYLGSASPTKPARPIDVVLAPGAPEDRFPGRLAENPHWDWIDLRHFTRWRSLGLNEDLDEAWLKLAASFYDVPERLLPVLRGEERRRRNRFLLAGALVAAVVAVMMTGLALLAATGRVEANKASARAQSYLEASQRRLANALATSAGTAREAGDELAATVLLAEARRTAVTPLVTAETLASEKPRAAFMKTLVQGNEDGAWAMAFDPRTGHIAVGSYDGAVRLLDVAGREERELLPAGGPPVVDLAFTSQGRRLFVLRRAPPDGAWNQWRDVPPESEIYRLELRDDASVLDSRRIASTIEEPHYLSLAVPRDEQALLVGSDRGVLVLPVDGGEATRLPETGDEPEQAISVAVSADGLWAAASSTRGHVRVWDLERQRETASHRIPTPAGGREYNPFQLGFAPTGDELAFGSFDGVVHLWRVGETAGPTRRLEVHRGAVASIAWSPDGRWLASGGYDGSTVLIDRASGKALSRLSTTWPGLTSGTLRLAFSSDGQRLATSEAVPASASARRGGWLFGTVRLWSLTAGPRPTQSVSGLSFTRTGDLAVWDLGRQPRDAPGTGVLALPCAEGRPWTALHESRVRRRPVAFLEAAESARVITGRVAKPTGPAGRPLLGPSAVHPDGGRVSFLTGRSAPSEDGIVGLRFLVCEAADPTPRLEVPIPVDAASTWAPIVFDRTGSRAVVAVGEKLESASGTRGTKLFAVETASGTLERLGSWDSHATASLALSGDGRYVALSDEMGELAVLESETGTFTSLPRWLAGTPHLLAFDPRDRTLVAAGSAQLRIFDFVEGAALNERRPSVSLRFKPTALDISPAGSVLAVGDASGSIRFWDLEKLEELLLVEAHAGPVLALDASPDGQTLLTLGVDGLQQRGGFLPRSVPLTERLARLRLEGSLVGPLDRDSEEGHHESWPTATWEIAPDADAAAFWRLANEKGARVDDPDSWWGWLFWSGDTELSPGLDRWRREHPEHPLAAAVNNLDPPSP